LVSMIISLRGLSVTPHSVCVGIWLLCRGGVNQLEVPRRLGSQSEFG